mgnify:CR=1 FL=1
MNAPFRLPRGWAAALVAACVATGAGGQPPTEPAPGYSVADTGALQSLEALQRALAMKEAEAAALQEQLATTADDMQRDDVRRRLVEVRAAIAEQRRQFDGFAAVPLRGDHGHRIAGDDTVQPQASGDFLELQGFPFDVRHQRRRRSD